ncbi:hypothetical protein O7A70_33460 [Mesorhizobium sp. Cs1299R1N1]|uniref:hypothetical protein n=1 Tax=Mesorhizobium sp. Cs1299R1N1 TaxID=3015172 RepID=UPI00301E44CE
MTWQFRWHCRHGTRTADNRDHAGIGIRGDAVLAIVLDGSTSGSASGDFAREIARRMVDWFVTGIEEVTADALIAQLRRSTQRSRRTFAPIQPATPFCTLKRRA